jgi:ribonuclease J
MKKAISSPNRPDELVFVALGGVGEIGMNLSLYGYNGRWLMIDCGITFADDTVPGIDIIMPDPAFIAERADQLDGLFCTHAHEDHIGAVAHLWEQFRCPVYATPFTAAVLRAKLTEAGMDRTVPIHEVPLSGHFSIGQFELELITMTHSIPEPNAVVLRTPFGSVLHTGDWKFDPDPQVGHSSDEAALKRLGDEGVLAMVCDSTNVLRPGSAGSEADVKTEMIKVIGECKERVAVACFASNVARLSSIAIAAAANDRHAALVGRSLWRMDHAARETGYLQNIAPFLTDEEAAYLPRDKVVLICTGSQGEPRAALWRIAEDDHPEIILEPGDTVVFSSRVIPGNERSIGRLQNKLAHMGVDIITDNERFVHVSGHPAQDELTRMYELVRPRIALPVHGEARHLMAHAKLAEDCGAKHALVTHNGQVVKLAPGNPEVIGEISTGRLVMDGKNLLPLHGEALKSRVRMTWNGTAVATVVVDADGRLKAPAQVTVQGLSEDPAALAEDLRLRVEEAIADLPPRDRRNDAMLKEAVRLSIRRAFKSVHGKRPVTDVHVVRI